MLRLGRRRLAQGQVTGWAEQLVRESEQLSRWLPGRIVRAVPEGCDALPASRFLERGYLKDVIEMVGGLSADPTIDIRVAASRFTRHYTAAVAAAALVALGSGIGLTLSVAACTIGVRRMAHGSAPRFQFVLDDYRGVALRCAERPTSWDADGPMVATIADLREAVWRGLYAEHLAPLFELVREITKVGENLLWSNAAEWVGLLSDAAASRERAHPIVGDRIALFAAPSLPGLSGPNPIAHLLEWRPYDAPDFPFGVQLRRVCCLNYLMVDRNARLCGNCCFLPLDDAVALHRERRRVPVGAAGGAAEQRAIELGKRKLRAAG